MFIFGKKDALEVQETVENARIKVLGSGCAKCNELEKNVRAALKELGLNEPVAHVKDFKQIAAYGVITTPALVIDEAVVVSGRLLKKDEVVAILKDKQF